VNSEKTLGQIAYESLNDRIFSMRVEWKHASDATRKDYEYIAQAVSAAVQPKWLPISTAPKDEPLIVVANGIVQNIMAKHYGEGEWFDSDDYHLQGFEPTHYMLPPPAPKKEWK